MWSWRYGLEFQLHELLMCGVKLATSKRDTQTSVHDLMIWLSQICGFFSTPESFDSEGHKMRRRYTVFKPERKSLTFVLNHVMIWEWFCSNVFCFQCVVLNPFPPSVLFYFTDKWQSNDKQIFKSFKNVFANFFGERKSIWYIGQALEFWNGVKREQNNLMADSVIHMDSSDYRH